MKRYLSEDQAFVEGRSAAKAAELLEAAGKVGLAHEVFTTTGGYIVPKSILGNSATVADSDEEAAEEFDPSEATVDEVRAYLEGADEDERARVLAAEADGKARKSIIGE